MLVLELGVCGYHGRDTDNELVEDREVEIGNGNPLDFDAVIVVVLRENRGHPVGDIGPYTRGYERYR